MSLSLLPPELIRAIIRFTRPASPAGYTNLSPRLVSLSALCSVSTVFRSIATEYLYEHLLLPTEASARLLLRTLASDRWTTGEMAGQARRLVRSVRLGKAVSWGEEVDGGFVGDVLASVGGEQLEEAGFAGLGVDGGAFKRLERMLQCSPLLDSPTVQADKQPRTRSVVTHLSLISTELIIDDDSAITLPALTHLHLQDTRISDKVFGDYSAILSPDVLPRLRHLASVVSSHDEEPTHASTEAAFATLAPQLRSLSLDEHISWLGTDDVQLWSSMANLSHLHVILPLRAEGDAWVITRALEQLPSALRVLDLCTREDDKFLFASGAVMSESVGDRASLRGLEVLRLPLIGAFRFGQSEEHVALREEVVASLEAVTEMATGRGAKVEWRDWTEDEWVHHSIVD